MRIVSPHNIEQHLRVAAEEYCSQHVSIDVNSNRITLPMIFSWYQQDFLDKDSEGNEVLTSKLADWLPEEKKQQIAKMVENQNFELSYAYDWTFNRRAGL